MTDPFTTMVAVIALGVTVQWICWRTRIPSILLLLAAGVLAGPVSAELFGKAGINPDAAFGDVLPFVTIAVGLILYEGGLTLRFRDIKGVQSTLWLLVTVGAGVTFAFATTGALLILGLPTQLAFLLGAVVVVTGPTVIGPLIKHVRPTARVAGILKWEGIVIDPIGASLAVLVFEVIIATLGATEEGGGARLVAIGVTKTIVVGGLLGYLAARLLMVLVHRYWIPDDLRNPISIMLVLVALALSNAIMHESGLLAVTVMGVVLANQSKAQVATIIEFKENLRVLLISALFILLGARLDLAALREVFPLASLFVLFLILVVRPASVFISSIGSELTIRERFMLSWVAPRGIVAAAVASIFAERLAAEGFPDTESLDKLVPLTFVVIIGTVATYGLTASFVAKKLKVSDQDPQGILCIGAPSWMREVARVLNSRGVRVLLVDTNRNNIAQAQMAGLDTRYFNVLAEGAADDLDLTGIGRILAVTPNDEVNALVAQRYNEHFGRAETYQLHPADGGAQAGISQEFRGRTLFGDNATFAALKRRVDEGQTIKATTLSAAFPWKSYKSLYGEAAIPLFLISPAGRVSIMTPDRTNPPEPGQTVIALIDPDQMLMQPVFMEETTVADPDEPTRPQESGDKQ